MADGELTGAAVGRAMGRFLTEWPWLLFCTWTFRARISEERAVKEIRRWLWFLSWGFGGDVGWVMGLEQEMGAEWPHGHGLVCGLRTPGGGGGERALPLVAPYWRAWFDRHGSGRFVPVTGGASFYCGKYATKRGAIYFSENVERYKVGGFVGVAVPVVAGLTLFP